MIGKNVQEKAIEKDFLKGQTKLRFMIFPPQWRIKLDANNPETYTMGIGNCLFYLLWINQHGQMDLWKWTKVEHKKVTHTANDIVKIFNSDFDEEMRYDIYMEALMVLKILYRLDEINTQKLTQIIQSYQLEDGGFKSIPWNYSELSMTLRAVFALDCINKKPLNCSSVRDFVYSLQVTKSPYETRLYEFRNSKEEGSDPFGTLKAYLILKNLGFVIPHKEELQKKFEKELKNFQVNYTNWSLKEKVVQLFWLAARSYMFPEGGKEVREELQSKAWEIHDSLHDDHPYLKHNTGSGAIESFLCRTMTLLGNAKPKLDVYFSPKEIAKEEKTHKCKLLINNSSPFVFRFTIKELEIINEVKNFNIQYPINNGTYTLKPNEIKEIPLTIERKRTSKDESPESTIELKVSLLVPVMHSLWDFTNIKDLTSHVFFTIPIKENKVH